VKKVVKKTSKVVAVGTIVEDIEGKILVLRRSDNIDKDKEPGTLGLPAGLLRPNRTYVETAVMKLAVEVGIKAKKSSLEDLGKYTWEYSGTQVEFYVFRLKLKGRHPEIKLSAVGHDSYIWGYPHVLVNRKDLMEGMYYILPGVYKLSKVQKGHT